MPPATKPMIQPQAVAIPSANRPRRLNSLLYLPLQLLKCRDLISYSRKAPHRPVSVPTVHCRA